MNKVDFTEEELEMMETCDAMTYVDCVTICPYNKSEDGVDKCADFIVNHNCHTPGFVYRKEVLNEK